MRRLLPLLLLALPGCVDECSPYIRVKNLSDKTICVEGFSSSGYAAGLHKRAIRPGRAMFFPKDKEDETSLEFSICGYEPRD